MAKLKKKLGQFVLEKQIGKGSAANIFVAVQNSLGRKLVIKELLPIHHSNDKIISRFKREAKVISQISHDAIVHIYDYWIQNDSYYIAMEYVQGKDLKEILSISPVLPIHIATMIVYQICRGLIQAHNAGITHRDLKPSNIILSKTGQVKILDFGIAHSQYDDNITSMGAVIGTFHYMSPEQALGKKVTPVSDIFSLGILYYEMITGFKPFIKDEKYDVLEKIIGKKFTNPRKINPAIPIIVTKVIRKCLRRSIRGRFKNIDKVKEILEKYLKNYPLDHQAVLKDYLENLIPKPLDKNWPPVIHERIIYRITHQSLRTYILILVLLGAIIWAEYTWIQSGIGLKDQSDILLQSIKKVFFLIKNPPQ